MDTLLRVRRLADDRARRALAEAQLRVMQQEEAIAIIDAETRRAIEELHAAGATPQPAGALYLYVRFLDRLAGDRERAAERLRALEAQREERRRARIETRRAVRVLERLRERRLAEWRAEMERHEQWELDEVGTRRWRGRPLSLGRAARSGRVVLPLLLGLFLLILCGAGYFYFGTPRGQALLRGMLDSGRAFDLSRVGEPTVRSVTQYGTGIASEGPGARILTASDVMALSADELARIQSEALQRLKAQWDEVIARQAELEAQQSTLQEKEATLAAWERELERYAAVVDASFAELEGRLERERHAQSQAKKDRYDMVAQTVRGMDPREAAKFFLAMDEELAYNVLSRLNTRTTGEIFNELSRVASATESARLITLLSLTQREQLFGAPDRKL